MSVVDLKSIDTYFVTTEEEAEQLVVSIKESGLYSVISHTITKKTKKEFEYYVVKVTKEFNTEKNLFDQYI